MKKTWIVALVVSFLPLVATAAARNSIPRAEILKQVESSMLVKGTIETNPDGSVDTVTIDRQENFPAGLVDFVQKQVLAWKFEPVLVDGKAMRVRSPMSARVVARKVDEDNYSIAIRNASFEGDEPAEGETLTSTRMTPPRYPPAVAMSGASGVAYLLVKVGEQGRVVDAIVEQVNLKTVGTSNEMTAWRKALADAALGAARQWKFKTPVKGEQANQEFWSARIPVAFYMSDSFKTTYGKWEMYIPGPRQSAPWSEENRPGFSPDALADGGIYMIGLNKGPRLLTALDGS